MFLDLKKKNLIITGPTGFGKSYISFALGNNVCICRYRTVYYNYNKIFSSLKISKIDDTHEHKVNRIKNQGLFIFDDFGIQPIDLQSRLFLLEKFEYRHGMKSTVISEGVV